MTKCHSRVCFSKSCDIVLKYTSYSYFESHDASLWYGGCFIQPLSKECSWAIPVTIVGAGKMLCKSIVGCTCWSWCAWWKQRLARFHTREQSSRDTIAESLLVARFDRVEIRRQMFFKRSRLIRISGQIILKPSEKHGLGIMCKSPWVAITGK